ncbi:MAG: bifunctional glutamate N-acetyltransferase/amino-acid acetyltransferase ArgJ [Dehalococcoidia bacterium]|nr:bifunctional glutamate N-acetyltransferase/amino-acid acetyltransferase ArgJ [Dehalococcoidia bacterium]
MVYYPFVVAKLTRIEDGTVTTPTGFLAGAVEAGIKYQGRLDLGVLYSERPCTAVGVFTTNKIKSAPVLFDREQLKRGVAQAIVVNSGCANACTGSVGMKNAMETALVAAGKLRVSSELVLVASTGVIGTQLPMDRVKAGLDRLEVVQNGGHSLARAMMTTDTFPKEIAVAVDTEAGRFTVGGVAKGAGMIHPNMATLLCFVATDALVSRRLLGKALKRAVGQSFNMISVDGDTSPSDSVIVLANGMSGIEVDLETLPAFQEGLGEVCLYLAKCIVRDGEGATKLIEITVGGALNESQARRAARTISASPLVKAAVHGADPNWGRVIAALGRSGASLDESRIDMYLNGTCVMRQGQPQSFDKGVLSQSMRGKEVRIEVDLNLGTGKATAWGCDLSEDYVGINADYTT